VDFDIQMIFNAVIVAMLAAIIVLSLLGRKKTNREDASKQIDTLLRQAAQEQRLEVSHQIASGTREQFAHFGEIQKSVQNTLKESREEASKQLDRINATLEAQIKSLQDSNEKRLENMQRVVDEKLQSTLETRLTQSFELVSKQLDSVQQGLGEMKSLAADAKSLKNALTNVKDRGTYGEVRLEWLLADILAPNQYEANATIADNRRVDFVVKLPGSGDAPLLLPIDSKFPIEDYNRLLDAEDKASIDEARKALATRIRNEAKGISEKYIVQPTTTDFALMFLPTEGLYAEVVQNTSLFEELRDKYKVTVVGATTLSAFLSSLRMGFKTLAIEQRSQEVWDTLRAVKAEFEKFAGALDKAQDKIKDADKMLDNLKTTRSNVLRRKLRSVSELNSDENMSLTEDDEE